jgi:hypothetical protein
MQWLHPEMDHGHFTENMMLNMLNHGLLGCPYFLNIYCFKSYFWRDLTWVQVDS